MNATGDESMSLKQFDTTMMTGHIQQSPDLVAEAGEHLDRSRLRPAIVRRARTNARSLSRRDVMQLQRTIGHQATRALISQEGHQQTTPRKSNGTGMPDDLKAGIETFSGVAMDDVKVHYNSSRPAMMQALAYTQGAEIHVAPGQEQHLAHEAWHVVQQKQGRVSPTVQINDQAVNDDPALELEASQLSARAVASAGAHDHAPVAAAHAPSGAAPIQAIINSDEFRAQTPGTRLRPRKTVDTIDHALDAYHGSDQVHKLQAMDALQDVIMQYLNSKILNDPTNVRIEPVKNLMRAATQERPLVYRLDILAQRNIAADLANIGQVAALSTRELSDVAQIFGAGAVTDIAALLNEVGNGALLLALLQDATAAGGAGTPGLRLHRVLRDNPLTPRTRLALAPLLSAQKQIDEKILRGRLGAPLLPGQAPTADQRELIGGHSPAMFGDQAYMIEATVNNPNLTQYVGFRKLIRSDIAGFANAVTHGAIGNILSAVQQQVAAVVAAITPAPTFHPRTPANIQQANQQSRLLNIPIINNAQTQVTNHVAAVLAAAPNAAANVNSATATKPFVDAISDLFASARSLVDAADQCAFGRDVSTAVRSALAELRRLEADFEQNGPVLSVKKNSTLAPNGWTDDDILRAGDETAAVPATLIRHRTSNNAPADGDIVETKHQKLIQGMVWVVMKGNVTFRLGPPPTLVGGAVISSYPTNGTLIPPDPIHPNKDADGFSAIP